MRHFPPSVLFVSLLAASVVAQTKPRPTPAPIPSIVPVKPGTTVTQKAEIDKGTVDDRSYANKTFGFELVFPDTWQIAGDDFDESVKAKGFDLSLKAPDSLPPTSKATVNRALKHVNVLLTAFRATSARSDNAILRISAEDLSLNPQIKDAVDYFDAIRAMYRAIRLPADFTYSVTQAERLGKMQFGYLDTSSSAGKKRIYATTRNGYALIFAISYTRDDDLRSVRDVLARGNFALR